MTLAIPEAIIHRRAYRAFTESLRVEHGKHLSDWEKLVEEWEKDKTKPCPYNVPRKGDFRSHPACVILTQSPEISFAEVRKELSVSDHANLEKGDFTLSLNEVTPSGFVVAGLGLEERQ